MKIGIFGDSRVAGVGALPNGYEGIDELMRFQSNHTFVKFATPSTIIAYMRTLWAALSQEEQQSFDYLIMEVGHNDFSSSASNLMGLIQGLVDDLYSTKSSSCKIIVNQITPMVGTWVYNGFNSTQIASLYVVWLDVNNCIAGGGSYPLIHVDHVCTEHIALLEDPLVPGRLKTIYESGVDLIHPNRLGKDIIANCDLKFIL